MIDTIVFKIHDLELHKDLLFHLDKQVKFQGKTNYVNVENEDFTPEQKLVHRNYIMFHDTNKMIATSTFQELKSNHYTISYLIDYVGDFISFNMSLPKYAYGTNIQLFIPAVHTSKQGFNELADIEKQLHKSFLYMEIFFKKFFGTQFPDCKVKRSFIEINRIDFCYNQVFPNRDEAIQHLNHLKLIKKKYARESGNYSRSWETSLMYKTNDYSFKVYHKGSEYKATDRKKHTAINKQEPGTFDTKHLQKFADRILRYEMTIRKGFMSYQYLNYHFRKECAIWHEAKELANTAKSKKITGKYLEWRKNLTAVEANMMQYAKKILDKRKTFFLGTNLVDLEYENFSNRNNVEHLRKEKHRYNAHFDKEFYSLLVESFLKILQEFRLEQKKDKNEILFKLQMHNQKMIEERKMLKDFQMDKVLDKKDLPRKINLTKIKFALDLLDVMSWEEIKQQEVYTERTWYNIRKDLEFLGITQQTNLYLTMAPPFNLNQYHTELTYHTAKYKNLNFLM